MCRMLNIVTTYFSPLYEVSAGTKLFANYRPNFALGPTPPHAPFSLCTGERLKYIKNLTAKCSVVVGLPILIDVTT